MTNDLANDPKKDFETILHHQDHHVLFQGLNLLVMDGVFTPDPAVSLTSTILANSLRPAGGKTVLDMGCGTGALAVYAARQGAVHVTAVDVDERALENTRLNVESNGVSKTVEMRSSDLFDDVQESFDIIVANLPINDDFWSVESGTLSVAERFISEFRLHLNPEGRAYLAWGSFGDVAGLRSIIKKCGVRYSETERFERGYTWYLFTLSH